MNYPQKQKPSASQIILAELRTGPRASNQLLWACIHKTGRGAVIHSRIAELRARGYEVECSRTTIDGQAVYTYTLIEDGEVAA